jgi:hypothetical protein
MAWVPTARVAVLQLAVLLLVLPASAMALQPAIVLPLSVKPTLPVGLTPVTVAVNVTLVPEGADGAELVTAVTVAAGAVMVCDSGALLDAALPASPA